ncbi:MAG: hypothetical protein FWH22_04640, partial [Fibromonadales bacterium]|nr:hypothetical protein [Fibromonadales bacterium]
TTASIGASDLSKTAKALEIAGKQKDLAFIELHTAQFLQALETLLNNINAAILAHGKEKSQNSMDFEALKNKLSELNRALVAFDYVAIDKGANDLQEWTQAAEVGGKIESILQNILIGEHEEAVAEIERLY